MEKKDTSAVQALIDGFDDLIEENSTLSDDERRSLAAVVRDRETLENGLPILLRKSNDMKEYTENCDKQIKTWQESKKMWSGRQKEFMALLGTVLSDLHISGSSIKASGIKLATSRRSSLEVNEDWLLGQYEALREALQQQVPDFVKVSFSLDKTKLKAYLDKDDSLLVNHPDMIHTKVSVSTTIR